MYARLLAASWTRALAFEASWATILRALLTRVDDEGDVDAIVQSAYSSQGLLFSWVVGRG